AQEAEALKKQLEIVNDEDDDVFTKATPLGRKAAIVDYEIVMINNKPRYKIIRADDTHQLYISFITLLKNFDREDLEDLWRIVKEKFSTSKPSNFSDDYLLSTLKTMFEKTDGQDAIWRNQNSVYGQALVKNDTTGVEADLSNMENNISASPTPTFIIHKDHLKSQIIGLVDTLVQTRTKSKEMEEQSFIASIHYMINLDLLHFCLFLCFLSQEEPKKISDSLKDPIYQMDVKSAFLYGTIDEEVYVMQPHGFQDPEFPARVYKVEKEMYGLRQPLRAWYGTLSKYLLTNGF
nr:putative ribonuclease H-like domain-containing protein [Tanacetum cinerariifolium]